jgi:hypothetical protein
MCNKKILYKPEGDAPQCFSIPSTAAAIAFPFSAALSIGAMASYKHLAMSRIATTSPFSTTGKCLNLPAKHKSALYSEGTTQKQAKKRIAQSDEPCNIYYQPCTIFWSASTARVSVRTNTGFLVITMEQGVSSRLTSRAITLVVISFNHKKNRIASYAC